MVFEQELQPPLILEQVKQVLSVELVYVLLGQVVTQEVPLKYLLPLQEVHALVPAPLQLVQLLSQVVHVWVAALA